MVLFNPQNQGYGGNQKLGYHYALERDYDFVALIHGDGQYAPECLGSLLEPLRNGEAAAVFGSRMLTPSGARGGGMPLYKFVGNKILTWIENKLLRAHLSEFHSGYRIYSTKALAAIPFDRNSKDFHFDTEIIIQLVIAGLPIRELPIPTYYGDEICYVNGTKYAFNVVMAAIKARLQSAGLFYDRKFDCAPSETLPYVPKFTYTSPHTLAFERIRPGTRVLDIGCAGGYMGAYLDQAEAVPWWMASIRFPCRSCGWGRASPRSIFTISTPGCRRSISRSTDYVLMLDVIEHLAKPELFLERLRSALSLKPSVEVFLSTTREYRLPRYAFHAADRPVQLRQARDSRPHAYAALYFRIVRAGGKAGAGFDIVERVGVPGPMALALGENFLSRMLLKINRLL